MSVEFGQTWTLSDAFEVLGCDLPQHLPHHQFSSVNSTEGANRLPQCAFRKLCYPNIYHHPLRTPPRNDLLRSNPLRAPLGEVLPLRNQTLMPQRQVIRQPMRSGATTSAGRQKKEGAQGEKMHLMHRCQINKKIFNKRQYLNIPSE